MGTGTTFVHQPETSVSFVRLSCNTRNFCEFCNTSIPVPGTSASSGRLPYPEATNPTEHNFGTFHSSSSLSWSNWGTLQHNLPCVPFVSSRRQPYQHGCLRPPPAPPPPCRQTVEEIFCCMAWPAFLRLLPIPPRDNLCHLTTKQPAASTTPRSHLPPFLAAVHCSTNTKTAERMEIKGECQEVTSYS